MWRFAAARAACLCCFALPARMLWGLLSRRVPRLLLMRRPMALAFRLWYCRSIMAVCLRFVPPLPIMSANSLSWCFRLWTALQLTFHLRPAIKGWAQFALTVVLPSWNLRLTTKQSLRCARSFAMRSAASAAVATRSMPFVIYRQMRAPSGAMRSGGREIPSAPLSSRSSIRT